MSKHTDRRQHEKAKAVARLARKGYTHREIAAAVGIEPEQVAKRIELGERLLSLEPTQEASCG